MDDRDKLTRLRRFMAMVDFPENPAGCWIWTGNRPGGRHGHFCVAGAKTVKAHRWIYALVCGEIPDDKVIRHMCDNPGCVNPEHLTIGTVADNNRDRAVRGRSDDRKGEKHPMAKVGPDDVRRIRQLASLGNTYAQVAEAMPDLGISTKHIGKIVRRESWGHIG